MSLYRSHVASASQFTRPMVEDLCGLADRVKEALDQGGQAQEALQVLKGRVMAPLFFENSSRTFSSFVVAMERLGGSVLTLPIESSSISKGESLSDTLKTIEQYSDVIVLRHPRKEALDEAIGAVQCPVMNAGNGTGEHPTQSLLDTYTIRAELGTVDGLHIALVGDLKNGRTVHSLVRLLTNFNVKAFSFVGPPELQMPQEICDFLKAKNVSFTIHAKVEEVIGAIDVLYVTRVQKERFASLEEYEAVRHAYTVNKALLSKAKAKMIVMHPLPRNEELCTDVDDDPRAAYFRQMRCGMIMRMAILLSVFGQEKEFLRGAVSAAAQTVKLQVSCLDRQFANPFMNAAGVLCTDSSDLNAMLQSSSGAQVSKSCTAEPRQGNPEPRYKDLPLGSINSMGLPNQGFDFYLRYVEERPFTPETKPLLFSMSGMSLEDNIAMARRLAPMGKAKKVLLELNLSCPNVPGKPQVGYDLSTMDAYLKGVTDVYDSPFGVKLPPYFDIAHFDAAADVLNRYPNVRFLTCINSVGNGLVVDVEKEETVIKPKGGFGGLGGQYVLPTALANVRAFFLRCPEKVIIGCGGIHTGETAFMHLLAGASLLQIGTQLHGEGPTVFARVARELQEVMARKGYKSIEEFRGKLKVVGE